MTTSGEPRPRPRIGGARRAVARAASGSNALDYAVSGAQLAQAGKRANDRRIGKRKPDKTGLAEDTGAIAGTLAGGIAGERAVNKGIKAYRKGKAAGKLASNPKLAARAAKAGEFQAKRRAGQKISERMARTARTKAGNATLSDKVTNTKERVAGAVGKRTAGATAAVKALPGKAKTTVGNLIAGNKSRIAANAAAGKKNTLGDRAVLTARKVGSKARDIGTRAKNKFNSVASNLGAKAEARRQAKLPAQKAAARARSQAPLKNKLKSKFGAQARDKRIAGGTGTLRDKASAGFDKGVAKIKTVGQAIAGKAKAVRKNVMTRVGKVNAANARGTATTAQKAAFKAGKAIKTVGQAIAKPVRTGIAKAVGSGKAIRALGAKGIAKSGGKLGLITAGGLAAGAVAAKYMGKAGRKVDAAAKRKRAFASANLFQTKSTNTMKHNKTRTMNPNKATPTKTMAQAKVNAAGYHKPPKPPKPAKVGVLGRLKNVYANAKAKFTRKPMNPPSSGPAGAGRMAKIGSSIKNTASRVGGAIKTGAMTVGNALKNAPGKISRNMNKGGVKKVGNALREGGSIAKNMLKPANLKRGAPGLIAGAALAGGAYALNRRKKRQQQATA